MVSVVSSSLSELLNRVILNQDKGGAANAKLSKLTSDYKILQTQLEKVNNKKKISDQEITSLNAKIKSLENELGEKKKAYAHKLAEFEAEKSTWENKYKQFGNELRKKDNVIKKYSEISDSAPPKDARVVNSVEITGEIAKHASKLYGPNEVRNPSHFSHTQSS